MFSLPTSVAQRTAPILNAGHLQLLTKIIIWMLQQHLLVQLHTYVTLALNDQMKCEWEDPVEKMAETDTNKNKPPKLLERLDQELEAEVTEDIDKLKRESSGTGTGKLSIKPMSDLIEPNSMSPSPPLSVAESSPPERTINGRRFVFYTITRKISFYIYEF